jgi:hypothetical protein
LILPPYCQNFREIAERGTFPCFEIESSSAIYLLSRTGQKRLEIWAKIEIKNKLVYCIHKSNEEI